MCQLFCHRDIRIECRIHQKAHIPKKDHTKEIPANILNNQRTDVREDSRKNFKKIKNIYIIKSQVRSYKSQNI